MYARNDYTPRATYTRPDGSAGDVPQDQQKACTLLLSLIRDLPEKDQEFARSLVNQAQSKGRRLTEKQMYWVDTLIARAKGEQARIKEPVKVGSLAPMAAMLALFKAGASKLKYPKVRLLTPGQKHLVLNIAGPRSSRPGTINVVDTQRPGSHGNAWSKLWYGRINKEGELEPSRDCDEDVVEGLKAFAEDPMQAALAYSRLTGNCCFCERKLTDERSIEQGYGPVCAKHFNMPWGERT